MARFDPGKAIVPALPQEAKDEGVPGWKPPGGLVPGAGWITWAQLIQRVWSVDVLRCARCGQKRIVIEVKEPEAIGKILAHLGLDPKVPMLERARPPPSWDVA